ncbi:hypothetical protein BT69DRAFT_1215004, partial [Atractiella rhizophila]
WDPETFYLSCLFHDLGCTRSNVKATRMSFEYFSAFLARDWLLEHGATLDVADLVAETICRHTEFGPGSIVVYGQLIQLGTVTDNVGLAEYGNLLHIQTVEEIVRAWPREGWSRKLYDALAMEKQLKPWSHVTAYFGTRVLEYVCSLVIFKMILLT